MIINGMKVAIWLEKDGVIVDDEGNFIMSADAMRASCRTLPMCPDHVRRAEYRSYRQGPNVLRKMRTSHKTYN